MSIIKNKINHIIFKEDKIREDFGIDVIIKKETKTPCPDCWDEFYKTSTNKNCPTCGGKGYIITTEDITSRALAKCLTEEELDILPFGNLKTGDYILQAKYTDKDIYDEAVKKQYKIIIRNNNYIAKNTSISELGTLVIVHCTRKEEL